MVRSIISSSSAWTLRYGAPAYDCVYGGGGSGADGWLPEIASSQLGGFCNLGESFVLSATFGGGGLEGAEDVQVEFGEGGLGGGMDACSLKECASMFVSSHILEST